MEGGERLTVDCDMSRSATFWLFDESMDFPFARGTVLNKPPDFITPLAPANNVKKFSRERIHNSPSRERIFHCRIGEPCADVTHLLVGEGK